MTLTEFAEQLKREYSLDRSEENARRIAQKINNAKAGGAPLSAEQKEEIIQRIEGVYIDGIKRRLRDSDNSAWLNAVAVVRSSVDGIKKK